MKSVSHEVVWRETPSASLADESFLLLVLLLLYLFLPSIASLDLSQLPPNRQDTKRHQLSIDPSTQIRLCIDMFVCLQVRVPVSSYLSVSSSVSKFLDVFVCLSIGRNTSTPSYTFLVLLSLSVSVLPWFSYEE